MDNIEDGQEDMNHRHKTAGGGTSDRRYYLWALVLAAVGMVILFLSMPSDHGDDTAKVAVPFGNSHRRLASSAKTYNDILKK